MENCTKHKSVFGGLFGDSCRSCVAGQWHRNLVLGILLMLDMVIGTLSTNGTLSSWRGRTFDQMNDGDLSHEWHDSVG